MRNLAHMWKLMMSHMYQEDIKLLITFKRLYGDIKESPPKWIQNGLRGQRRGTGLEFLLLFRVESGWGFLCTVRKLVWIKSAIWCYQRNEHLGFLINLLRCVGWRRRGKNESQKNCLQWNFKKGGDSVPYFR